MTKTENRAAAKAYHQEQLRKLNQEIRQNHINADLIKLEQLRRYLTYQTKARIPACELIKALDDYAEKLTGDPKALHEKPSRIG